MITAAKAAQRLDSRGNPTVQVDVETSKGICPGKSAVSGRSFRQGASTGKHEAVELRDSITGVYGVETAVSNLKDIDRCMREIDGTPNKSRLGANAILGVSMACARAGAAEAGIPLYEFIRKEAGISGTYVLPVPFMNVLNGGVHSGNMMAFQEFMIAPVGATSFAEAMRMGAEVYHRLKQVVAEKYGPAATGIGDEGGFAPPISMPEQAFDLLETAVAQCGYTNKVKYAIDPASSEFIGEKEYNLGLKQDKPNLVSPAELSDLYRRLIGQYPIVLLEDPFAEDDWDSWCEFNKTCQIELVGDDLLVTNVARVKEAHEKKACNAMLLKVNQIGTVTEAIEAANLAFSFGWSVFVSHRSGETTDDFIADLTIGLGTGHLKSGAPCRGERVAKYNRLMDIEAELRAAGKPCVYAGNEFRFPSSYQLRYLDPPKQQPTMQPAQ
ncbi:Enolase, C-terminal TIM barrel domain-containing protein [Cercophora newfieldiana]|uniref:Enolase n=1 Tax=Cercophora newfieldiana TaxID=92897 RepID=A0AA40D0M4_9PEZI|nr:Enolase, C-terminal TIM barrel domain-containing protein [Cercophora newfieldiana]